MFLLRDTHDHCDRRDHNNIALTFTVCREKDSKSDLILISIGQVTAALRKKPWWTTTTSFAARSSILLLYLELCLPANLTLLLLLRQKHLYTHRLLFNHNQRRFTFGRTLLILYTGIFLSTTSALLLLPPPPDEPDADEQVLLARVKLFARKFGSLTDFWWGTDPPQFIPKN